MKHSAPMKRRTLTVAIAFLLMLDFCAAQDVASFEKRITVKKLPNGLTLMICERPEAPVFSFYTLSTPVRRRIRSAPPASPTCSSTWPSRAPTRSAPPTTPPKSPRSPRSRRLRRLHRRARQERGPRRQPS